MTLWQNIPINNSNMERDGWKVNNALSSSFESFTKYISYSLWWLLYSFLARWVVEWLQYGREVTFSFCYCITFGGAIQGWCPSIRRYICLQTSFSMTESPRLSMDISCACMMQNLFLSYLSLPVLLLKFGATFLLYLACNRWCLTQWSPC